MHRFIKPIFSFVSLLWFAFLGLQQAQAQAPAWQSAIGVASGAVATVTGTVADAAGNVYVTGYYGGTARFGTIQLSTATLASVETFVAKWNPATGYVWAVRAGGSGSGGPAARALALQGTSIYVAGDFSSQTATFGNTVLTNA